MGRGSGSSAQAGNMSAVVRGPEMVVGHGKVRAMGRGSEGSSDWVGDRSVVVGGA